MPTPDEIKLAAELLRSGRVVAFPTETVYGLGANALDPGAVSRIYAVKRRPPTSPLIVHIASTEMIALLAADWPEAAERLTRMFWPGPLTLVVRKQPGVPEIVTAGVPIAAPSANRFTELSPTTADHVRRSLGNDVDYILDGGPCEVGIESTVLSLAGPQPVLLRPGGISRQALESLLGPIASVQAALGHEVPAGAHPSPGMHARHYSPLTFLLLVSNGKVPEQGRGIYLQHAHAATRPNVTTIQMPTAAADYAAALYEKLHQSDEANADWIAVDLPPNEPEWEAVQDRLHRAASND